MKIKNLTQEDFYNVVKCDNCLKHIDSHLVIELENEDKIYICLNCLAKLNLHIK